MAVIPSSTHTVVESGSSNKMSAGDVSSHSNNDTPCESRSMYMYVHLYTVVT